MNENFINQINNKTLDRDAIAKILKVHPELLEKFEAAYEPILEEMDDNFFNVNSKQASQANKKNLISMEETTEIVNKIVDELLNPNGKKQVTNKDLESLPEELRPQLTGHLMKKQIGVLSYPVVVEYLSKWLETGDVMMYHMFRQGLDILDLDPVLYEIIGQNQNSMGHWLTSLETAADKTGFFKYPKTKVVKIPLPILQLTRLDYSDHTPTTLKIVNEFCMKAFNLDVNKKYFIKTGTYSSKFDFRNALVQGEKEVQELGEYLLFIHYQALQMASPLSRPTIYGVSTTNEWVVREFVEDVENNPKIYKGMPLRTEYRFFVDFDNNKVMGVSPYWREDVMIRSFNRNPGDPHNKHDYVVYKMHENKLYDKYNKNVDKLTEEIQKLIENMDLKGQWSLDVMQNGDDFYLIDMAGAADSALSDCVPQELLKKNSEQWIPMFNK